MVSAETVPKNFGYFFESRDYSVVSNSVFSKRPEEFVFTEARENFISVRIDEFMLRLEQLI